MDLPLNDEWQDPSGNTAQVGYLHSFREENFFIAGRGSGKTISAVVKAVYTALFVNPGAVGYITEATGPDIEDILKPVWFAVVPRELYAWSESKLRATFDNGSVIKFRPRHATNQKRDPFRGPTVGWIIHDEIAMDKSRKVWELSLAMLRDKKARVRFADGITTPKLGWLKEHMDGRGVGSDAAPSIVGHGKYAAYYGCTKDNQYGGQELYDRLAGALSDEHVQQELHAKWISLSGRAYPGFVADAHWPDGNLIYHEFDRSQPWMLCCDLGLTSAWLVCQWVQPTDQFGHMIFNQKPVLVLCAEFKPGPKNPEGADQTITRIEAEYGKPQKVAVGHDFKTSSVADSKISAAVKFREREWNMSIDVISGWRLDHELGHIGIGGLVSPKVGKPRICVASDFHSHDSENNRGVREMFQMYSYPDDSPKTGEFLPRDGAYEHIWDALRYGVMAWLPPTRPNRVAA